MMAGNDNCESYAKKHSTDCSTLVEAFVLSFAHMYIHVHVHASVDINDCMCVRVS